MPVVRLFGSLRRSASQSCLTLPGETVRVLLDALCKDDPQLCAAILDGDKLHQYVRVMINGRDIELMHGLDTPLATKDEVAIFPPIAGGVNNF